MGDPEESERAAQQAAEAFVESADAEPIEAFFEEFLEGTPYGPIRDEYAEVAARRVLTTVRSDVALAIADEASNYAGLDFEGDDRGP